MKRKNFMTAKISSPTLSQIVQQSNGHCTTNMIVMKLRIISKEVKGQKSMGTAWRR